MRPRRGPTDVTNLRGSRGPAGIHLHRSRLTGDERAVEARIPVTAVARTLLDLGEVLDEDGLRRAFEEADRLKLLRMPELERVCARARGRKGLVALGRLIDAAREPVFARSPLENRFAEFFREHLADLPSPLTNATYPPRLPTSRSSTRGRRLLARAPSRRRDGQLGIPQPASSL